jgi:hypothetical protein
VWIRVGLTPSGALSCANGHLQYSSDMTGAAHEQKLQEVRVKLFVIDEEVR